MNEIPDDVMEAAVVAFNTAIDMDGYEGSYEVIARAILAERIKRDNEIDSLKKVITGILDEPRVDVHTDCHMGVYIYEEAVLVTSDAFRYAVRRMDPPTKPSGLVLVPRNEGEGKWQPIPNTKSGTTSVRPQRVSK